MFILTYLIWLSFSFLLFPFFSFHHLLLDQIFFWPFYLHIWFHLFEFCIQVSVSQICFYLDFNLDDSYTPKKVSIRSGTSSHDLIDITAIELNEPVGIFLILFISLYLYLPLCFSVCISLYLCICLCLFHLPYLAISSILMQVGWVTVTLPNLTGCPGPLKTHLLQLRILSMHQNGR